MRSFPRLAAVALVALAVALAGCASNSPPPAAPPSSEGDAQAAADAALANVTNDDGSGEMEGDLGHAPHIHDYWKDRERVTLMDEDVVVDAPDALFWTFVGLSRQTPGVGGAMLRLPDGQIVYEGTGTLEFTATWTDPTVTGMTMSYRSPAENSFGPSRAVQPGTPLSVDVTPEMTDMPHAKTSRWQFVLLPASGQTMVGTFHVKVDILRVHDIEVFPGHPELFGGEPTLEVFNGAGSSTQQNFATQIANFVTRAQTDDGVRAEKVVPMETLSMTANLTIKDATATMGQVSDIRLGVKTADRNGYRWIAPVAKDEAKKLYQFAWLVEMGNTDSPYAEESDWKFDVFASAEHETLPGEYQWAGSVKVDYSLVVVAYDSVVEGAKALPGGQRGF